MGPFKGFRWWTLFLCAGLTTLTGCSFGKLLFQVEEGKLDPKYGAREGSEMVGSTNLSLNSGTH